MTDLEGPTTRIQQDSGTAWIVHEREAPGAPPWWFLLASLLSGTAVAAVTIALGALRGDALAAESAATGIGPFGLALELLGLETLRVFAGIVAGATVVAAAFAGRRLSHSEFGGLLAAVLMALDPSLLLEGQLAVATGFLRFAAVGSLALALGGHQAWRWLATIPLGAGVAIMPEFLLWGIPLVGLLWLRGHIYSAPKHLGRSILQALVVPGAIGLGFHMVSRALDAGSPVVCGPTRSLDASWLAGVPQYDALAVAVPNLVTWFGGLALLLGLALTALGRAATSFRLTRAPGRFQIRLPGALGRLEGRAIWLLGLALFAPVPSIWLPLGAFALALGIHQLDKDNRGFAGAVGVAVILFAVLFLVRFAAALGPEATASDLQTLLDIVPWSAPIGCTA